MKKVKRMPAIGEMWLSRNGDEDAVIERVSKTRVVILEPVLLVVRDLSLTTFFQRYRAPEPVATPVAVQEGAP